MTFQRFAVPILLALVACSTMHVKSVRGQIHIMHRGIEPAHCDLCPLFTERCHMSALGVCHYATSMKYRDHISFASKPQGEEKVTSTCPFEERAWYDAASTWLENDGEHPDPSAISYEAEVDVEDAEASDVLDANEYDFQYDYDLVMDEANVRPPEPKLVATDPYDYDVDQAYRSQPYDCDDWYAEEDEEFEREADVVAAPAKVEQNDVADTYYYGNYDYGFDYDYFGELTSEYGPFAVERSMQDAAGVHPQQLLTLVRTSIDAVLHAAIWKPGQTLVDGWECELQGWMHDVGVSEALSAIVNDTQEETYPVSTPVRHPSNDANDHCGNDCELWYDYID